MKYIVVLIVSYLLLLQQPVSYAFNVIKHDKNYQQRVMAIDFDEDKFSYIYEKSLDFKYKSRRKYNLVIDGIEFSLPVERNKEEIKQAGFIKHDSFYKVFYLVDSVSRVIILGTIKDEINKKIDVSHIELPKDLKYINKVIEVDEGILLFSDNVWLSGIYLLNKISNKFEFISLKGNRGRRIVDFIKKDGKRYLLSLDDDNTLHLTVYSMNLSIIHSAIYSGKKSVLNAKIINIDGSTSSIVFEDYNNRFISFGRESNLYEVKIDYVENKIIYEKNILNIDVVKNNNIFDNLVFCKTSGVYYWADIEKRSLSIKSSKNNKYYIDLPERSFPRKVYIKSNEKELYVVVNFMKYIGKYFNHGFGFSKVSVGCS